MSHIEGDNPNPADFIEELWLERLARTGTTCGNGVFRFRGALTPFLDPRCLFTNPIRPVLDLFEDANFFARESVRRGRQFITATVATSQRLLDQFNVSTFVTTDRFRRVIEESIRFDLIRASERYIRVGAVDWDTGELRYFTKQDMTVDVGPKIVQASAAVPALFP